MSLPNPDEPNQTRPICIKCAMNRAHHSVTKVVPCIGYNMADVYRERQYSAVCRALKGDEDSHEQNAQGDVANLELQ